MGRSFRSPSILTRSAVYMTDIAPFLSVFYAGRLSNCERVRSEDLLLRLSFRWDYRLEEIASRERADVVNYVLDVGDSQHGELLELHLDHI